jgi:branched-subunit amino acid aminotransferase/4-amino-4-deoxychorismate lyase
MIAFADGVWTTDGAAPLADRGFTLGDGLFETVLVIDGAPARLSGHHARLAAGADALGFAPPPSAGELDALAREIVAKNGLDQSRAAVRFSWTAGMSARGLSRMLEPRGALYATAAPAPRPSMPARLITSDIRRNETAPSARWKTMSYIDNVIARRQAETAGADEALLLNTQGRLAGAAAACVLVALDDGSFATPPVAEGALPSVTCAALIAAGAPIRTLPMGIDELNAAPALALVNALIGVRPALTLDGRPLDPAWPAFAPLMAALTPI